MGHQQLSVLIELDPLDQRLLDAQQGSPRADIAHAVLRFTWFWTLRQLRT